MSGTVLTLLRYFLEWEFLFSLLYLTLLRLYFSIYTSFSSLVESPERKYSDLRFLTIGTT